MTGLTLKETKAVEYRYTGMSHQDIARRIDAPKQTVDEWFKPSRGRLSPYYQMYAEEMNAFRQKQVKKLMEDSDREMLLVIRLYLRRFMEVLLHGYKKPIMQNGEVVLDEKGQVRYYYESFIPSVTDIWRIWKMQRTMQGLPSEIKETRCVQCKKRVHKML